MNETIGTAEHFNLYEDADDSGSVWTSQVTGALRVRIENHRGDVSVRALEDLAEATAELHTDPGVDLQGFAPTFDGDQLQIFLPALIESNRRPAFAFSVGKHSWGLGSNRPRVQIKVTVPAGSSVYVETQSGDVSLAGRYAKADLKTAKGNISLEQATEAECSTGSGDISIRRVEGDVRANTGSGDISIADNGGRVKASTGSGDVTVARVVGEGKLSSGSGDLTIGEVEATVKLASGSGDFTIREIVSGAVGAQTASGDIAFGVRGAIPVWTDCTTMTGDVSSNLLGGGQPGDGEPYIEIRATTISGDITLTEV